MDDAIPSQTIRAPVNGHLSRDPDVCSVADMNAAPELAVDDIRPNAGAQTLVSERARFADIDRAKGVAIFLVVLGHLSREASPDGEWYMVLKACLYQFHMPFFMFLSGITMWMSYKRVQSAREYLAYGLARFKRLMPAFFLFGALVLFGKELASNFMSVENMHADLVSGAWHILTRPISSSAGFLWYVYTLCLFYAVMPLLVRISGGNPFHLLPLAVVLHILPLESVVADWFMLSEFAEYLLYLTVGFCIARHYARWVQYIDRYGAWFLAGFLTLLSGFLLYGETTVLGTKTVLGLAAIPALHALVRYRWIERGGLWALLGTYCFTIYLFNLLFVGLVRGIATAVLGPDGIWFPSLALVTLASGLLLPILLSRGILQRVPWLDRMTR